MIGNMDVQCHNTRINANIDFARCKYDIGLTKHRLSQEGTKLYNALPISFRELPYNRFKNDLKKLFIKNVSIP